MIEEDLRKAFAVEAAAGPPPVPGLADSAIRRAGRLRRRRAAVAVAAGLLALATAGLAVAGTGLPRDPRRPVLALPTSGRLPRGGVPSGPAGGADGSSPSVARASGAELDTISAGVLSTADGRSIRLPDPELTTAYRVPLGWLAVSATDRAGALWLVRPDGSARELLDRVWTAGLAVAPDGTRIAWQRGAGTPLATATLSAVGLSGERVARVGKGVALTGWYGRYVALGERRGTGAGFDRVDVWDPAAGYRPGPTAAAVQIIGMAGDRDTLLGLARPAGRSAAACLVQLDPARRLAAAGRRCLPEVTTAGRLALSPDGRMLAGRAGPDRLVVVDIAGAGPARPVTRIDCDQDSQEVWADAQTLVISTRTRVLRFRLGAPGPVALAPEVRGPVNLVPRMGG